MFCGAFGGLETKSDKNSRGAICFGCGSHMGCNWPISVFVLGFRVEKCRLGNLLSRNRVLRVFIEEMPEHMLPGFAIITFMMKVKLAHCMAWHSANFARYSSVFVAILALLLGFLVFVVGYNNNSC